MASGRAARTRASAGAGVSVPRSLEHHVGNARPLDGAGRAGVRREARRALRNAAATPSIPRYATRPPCKAPWEAHERHAVALQRALNRVSVPLARVAGGFVQGRLWTQFGYARLDDYARERLDRSGRFVRDLAALDRALDSLPGLAEALTGDDGRPALGRVAALRLARVATVESAARWIALARSVSVRELERELRAARAAGSAWPVTAAAESQHRAAAWPETEDADPSSEDRVRLSFHVPAAVRVAFDETRRLHASVAGRETGIAGFVEALVAEACAGPHPPDPPDPLDVARVPRLTGARARRETALDAERQARAGGDRASDACNVVGVVAANDARGVLSRLRRLEAQPWPVDAAGLQERLRQWLRLEDRLERRLGTLLVQMSASSPWSVQGYGDAGHFAEARLGLARSTAESRRGLARGLVQRPWLRRAYARGRIGACAAQLVVRILGRAAVDPAAERAWVERAGRATVKRLRDEARAIELGRLDGAQAIPPLPLDDRAWQASLRQDPGALRPRVQALLARAAFDRRPNVFLHLTLPESGADDVLAAVDAARAGLAAACVRTFSIAAGGGGSAVTRGVLGAVVVATVGATGIEVPGWVVAAAGGADSAAAGGADSAAAGGADSAAAGGGAGCAEGGGEGGAIAATDAVAGWGSLALAAAQLFARGGQPIPAWVGLAALLEDFVRTWDDPRAVPPRPQNRIYAREGWRCAAPGCTSRSGLEDHHVQYRSRGGDARGLDNRVCACAFHHRQGEHGMLARCTGHAPLGLRWGLGRADLRRWYANEIALERA